MFESITNSENTKTSGQNVKVDKKYDAFLKKTL